MVVEPKCVAAGLGGERPVDGGLAAALAVALEVVGEEGGRAAEVVAQGLHAEDLAGFQLDRFRF